MLKNILLSSLAILLVIYSPTNAKIHLDEQNLNKVNDYFEKLVEHTYTPCLTVGISHNSTFMWTEAFGPGADLENHIQCTSRIMLCVASVSKAIGSSLIAHLVEQRKLSWDDDISNYLSETTFPKKSWKGKEVNITIRQLISHQAGIRQSTDHELLNDWEFSIFNSTQLLEWFKNDDLLFEPGHGYHYSNHDWSLLGAIVEAIEKRPYHIVLEDFMKNNIGMPYATSETRDKLIKYRGQQYYINNSHPEHPIAQNILRPYPHWPAGHVISTVEDLLVYGQKMLTAYHGSDHVDPILKSQTINEMWNYINKNISVNHYNMIINGTVHVHNITSHYVLGWDRSVFPKDHQHQQQESVLNELIYISHTGQIESVNAKLAIFPQYDLVFAAIANRGELKQLMNEMPVETLYRLAEQHK